LRVCIVFDTVAAGNAMLPGALTVTAPGEIVAETETDVFTLTAATGYRMTVALFEFHPSEYATYGVPSGAKANDVYVAVPAENPAVPTVCHAPPVNAMTVAAFQFHPSEYATYGVPSDLKANDT
jgi:hypothetical protein